MNRRQHLENLSLLTLSLGLPSWISRPDDSPQDPEPMPEPGKEWNESETFFDPITGRKTIRLTTARAFNQKPTYHIGSGFSADSRYLPVVSWNPDSSSCLLRADVQTGQLKAFEVTEPGAGLHFVKAGNDLSMLPGSKKVVAGLSARELRLYDVESGKSEVLLPDVGAGFTLGHPIGSPDGWKVFVPKMKTIPPDTRDFEPFCSVEYLEFDLKKSSVRTVFSDQGHRNNHLIPNPRFPDLWLIDRDRPPGFARGGDGGKTTRCWILNIRTGALTEVRPQAENRFQVHGNWNYAGTHVYYHGLARWPENRENPRSFNGNSHYIGVADQKGQVVWEKTFPRSSYGHVSSHPLENTIVLDGLITESQITGIRWDQADAEGNPPIFLYGTHGSDWANIGQHAHPHCQLSPDGKWLSFNRSSAGRSDVLVMKMA